MHPIDPALIPPHSGPLGPTPPRERWSLRRTSTIDTTWPGGIGTELHMEGRARDLLTGADLARPHVLAHDVLVATVTPERAIRALATQPRRPAEGALVGSRAGAQLRGAIAAAMPEEVAGGTPLHLMLDDLAGASLVAGWIWPEWAEEESEAVWREQGTPDERLDRMINVCVGFSEHSPVVTERVDVVKGRHRPVAPLDAGDDPLAWHALPAEGVMASRRARRIDVRLDGSLVRVETHFQDSGTLPGGGRLAVHEYLVRATIDRATMTLASLSADPRILPFGYCPAATLNTDRILGAPVRELRQRVLDTFPKTLGCTHLNDTMRSLAEVPLLAAALEKAMAGEGAGEGAREGAG